MRVAVYGAGAMGTVLGAYIARSGLPIDLISRNKEHVAALKNDGAQIVGSAPFTQTVNAQTDGEMTGKYDLIFLMTKQRENAKIVEFLSRFLSLDGVICTLQNGLPEPSIAKIIGADRTYGCAVAWGATREEAGVVHLTSDPSALTFSLGAFGEDRSKLNDIAAYLSKMGKVETVSDLLGARWTKLSVNAAFSGVSAVTGMTFGEAAKEKKSRGIVLAVFRECARVAEAAGIRPAKIQGKNALYLLDGKTALKRAVANVLLPFAMRKHARLSSGMLYDLRAGKKCEIDYIDGVVSAYGKKYGVETPYCDGLCRIAHEIEEGKREISRKNSEDLPTFKK